MRLLGVFLLLIAVGAHAQLALQPPQPIYDGQNVSAVDLIGNPHRDVEPFHRLVEQKAGQPYSQTKVEASIAALKKSGQFPKVEVNVVPDVSGLRLNFLLEPSYYLGMITFPGAEKEFSYTRLLQSVDLRDQDPYDPSQVADAEKSLQDYLQHNGYFQAIVTRSEQIDDAHQLVSVAFPVTLGKQAKISGVTIQGVDASESSHLLHLLRSLRARLTGGAIKPGKSYSPERIKAATAVIKSALKKQHRLASHVKENPPQYNAETNKVDVSFSVELGPLVSVRVTGAKLSSLPFLSRREMNQLIPIYSEGAIDPDLVQEGERNLIDFFQKKGYYDAQVKADMQRQPEKIELVYEIEKGKKHKAGSVVFHGNHEIAKRDLMPAITLKKSHLWTRGRVSQKLADDSAKNMQALYRDRGYEEAKIKAQIVEHDPKIDVVFAIEEGPQTLVENVTVNGNASVPMAQIAAPVGLQLRAGVPFSPRKMADDRNRISANYLNRGYLNAAVKAVVKRDPADPRRVEVSYNIVENQLVRIRDVVYLGQEHTRLSLIEKAANFSSEQPIDREKLLQAQSHLYDLNIFDWSSVGPSRPISDQTEETLLVKDHEAKRNEVTYGFGFELTRRGGNTPSGTVAVPGGPTIQLGNNQIAPSQATYASPLGSIEFTRHNVRGLAETVGATLVLSRLDQRAITTYTQPHFLGSHWGSISSLSLERTSENPLFAASLGDASFQLERLLDRKTNTRLQLRYDFNKTVLSHILVPDLVLPEDMNVHLSTLSATLLRDTRDKPLDAHRGSFSTLNLGFTPTVLGSSANFAKLTGQFAFYRPFHSVVFANSIRIGLAKSFDGSFIPTSQLYFSGGGNSLRGFPIDEAGPQRLVPFCNVLQQQSGCVDITVPVGGNELFIFNSELRFPLPVTKAVGGVIFYDGGNVYSAINFNNFATNYTNTVGIGLRYNTPIGPIRIDVGRNLNPIPGIGATQYFITIGQAF